MSKVYALEWNSFFYVRNTLCEILPSLTGWIVCHKIKSVRSWECTLCFSTFLLWMVTKSFFHSLARVTHWQERLCYPVYSQSLTQSLPSSCGLQKYCHVTIRLHRCLKISTLTLRCHSTSEWEVIQFHSEDILSRQNTNKSAPCLNTDVFTFNARCEFTDVALSMIHSLGFLVHDYNVHSISYRYSQMSYCWWRRCGFPKRCIARANTFFSMSFLINIIVDVFLIDRRGSKASSASKMCTLIEEVAWRAFSWQNSSLLNTNAGMYWETGPKWPKT